MRERDSRDSFGDCNRFLSNTKYFSAKVSVQFCWFLMVAAYLNCFYKKPEFVNHSKLPGASAQTRSPIVAH